ncbi:phosphoesterase family-domain-containing protein [Zalerion maritima]|uniref:Phosphoesterase family-domain-containing protein n=1 Tax=Zalerion maritima TaxID=339359 RepID=A0AAD5RRH1_9PEZI|nr:phosphoesterase family-domain-containing protein [Zalerion maritima]
MGNSQSSDGTPSTMYLSTDAEFVAQAAATALTLSPTSSVSGKTFDRFVQVFLENQDFDIAAGDPSLAELSARGIVLDNYWAITHPSQPNYVAAVGGSTHGVLLDSFYRIDEDTSTIVDLLDDAGISWGLYQEDMPFSGFEADWVNQENGANDYVRKHNPLMSYDSATNDVNRLAQNKNFTLFYSDLESNSLPQWMFITPNMTNDGHDTSVTVAGNWFETFITPLLSDENFNSDSGKGTLVVLTFDECENYFGENKVFTLLLGSAIPEEKKGTTDSTKYNHYSLLKTVEENWGLGSLGEGDDDVDAFF